MIFSLTLDKFKTMDQNEKHHFDSLTNAFLAFLSTFGLIVFFAVAIVADREWSFWMATLLTLLQISGLIASVISGLGLYYNLKK